MGLAVEFLCFQMRLLQQIVQSNRNGSVSEIADADELISPLCTFQVYFYVGLALI